MNEDQTSGVTMNPICTILELQKLNVLKPETSASQSMLMLQFVTELGQVYITPQTLLLYYSIISRMISYETYLLAKCFEARDCKGFLTLTHNRWLSKVSEIPDISRTKTDQIARLDIGNFVLEVWRAAG